MFGTWECARYDCLVLNIYSHPFKIPPWKVPPWKVHPFKVPPRSHKLKTTTFPNSSWCYSSACNLNSIIRYTHFRFRRQKWGTGHFLVAQSIGNQGWADKNICSGQTSHPNVYSGPKGYAMHSARYATEPNSLVGPLPPTKLLPGQPPSNLVIT